MTTLENDFYTNTQKTLYPHNDLQAPVHPDPINGEISIPYYFTMTYNETGSFIVDWQMSTDEN